MKLKKHIHVNMRGFIRDIKKRAKDELTYNRSGGGFALHSLTLHSSDVWNFSSLVDRVLWRMISTHKKKQGLY